MIVSLQHGHEGGGIADQGFLVIEGDIDVDGPVRIQQIVKGLDILGVYGDGLGRHGVAVAVQDQVAFFIPQPGHGNLLILFQDRNGVSFLVQYQVAFLIPLVGVNKGDGSQRSFVTLDLDLLGLLPGLLLFFGYVLFLFLFGVNFFFENGLFRRSLLYGESFLNFGLGLRDFLSEFFAHFPGRNFFRGSFRLGFSSFGRSFFINISLFRGGFRFFGGSGRLYRGGFNRRGADLRPLGGSRQVIGSCSQGLAVIRQQHQAVLIRLDALHHVEGDGFAQRDVSPLGRHALFDFLRGRVVHLLPDRGILAGCEIHFSFQLGGVTHVNLSAVLQANPEGRLEGNFLAGSHGSLDSGFGSSLGGSGFSGGLSRGSFSSFPSGLFGSFPGFLLGNFGSSLLGGFLGSLFSSFGSGLFGSFLGSLFSGFGSGLLGGFLSFLLSSFGSGLLGSFLSFLLSGFLCGFFSSLGSGLFSSLGSSLRGGFLRGAGGLFSCFLCSLLGSSLSGGLSLCLCRSHRSFRSGLSLCLCRSDRRRQFSVRGHFVTDGPRNDAAHKHQQGHKHRDHSGHPLHLPTSYRVRSMYSRHPSDIPVYGNIFACQGYTNGYINSFTGQIYGESISCKYLFSQIGNLRPSSTQCSVQHRFPPGSCLIRSAERFLPYIPYTAPGIKGYKYLLYQYAIIAYS